MRVGYLAAALLSVTHLCQAAWKVQTVDSTAFGGLGSALELSANDVPSISYERPTTGFTNFFDIYYATWSGGSWTTEQVYSSTSDPGTTTSIVLTELGKPVVAFSTSGTFLRFYIRSGGSWEPLDSPSDTITTAAGDYISAVWRGTEAAPDPIIAYNDAAGADLERAYMTAGNFATSALDTSNAGDSCSLAQLDNYLGLVSIKGGKLLFLRSINGGTSFGTYTDPMIDPLLSINADYCAVALAAPTKGQTDPRAHIIYFYQGMYKYLTNDTETGVWTSPEVIYTSALKTVDHFGLSIAVGTDGFPQVAFFDYNNKTLRYSKRTSAGWPATAESVDGSNMGGVNCSLKLNSSNLPRIAFGAIVFDSGSSTYVVSGLKYAAFSNASGGSTSAAPSFAILGKKKLKTSSSKLVIKGDASSGAVAVQWRVGTKPLKRTVVASGKWSAKIGPLSFGKNKIRFQAVTSSGVVSPVQTLTIIREQ